MSGSTSLRIPVLAAVGRRPGAATIRGPWLFAMWMAVAALVAVAAGIVFGLLAVLEAGVGGDRWTQTVQAHGRLQLFGFVATFVVALALEFLPRLNQQPAFPARARLFVPVMLAAGALLSSIAQVWHEEARYLAVPGVGLVAAGAMAFALLVWRVSPARSLKTDPQPLFLRAAAAWLLAATALSMWALWMNDHGIAPLGHSRAVVETFLRGFVMFTVVGVALRAFVGHLGLRPLRPRRQVLVFGALNASLVAWLLGQGLGPMVRVELLERLGDAGYGATLIVFTVWFGVLGGLRLRRDRPAYALMIPIAWAGLVLYAAMLVGMAVTGAAGGLSLYQEGAVRHIFMLGFMVPLMAAMAHIVLARFGTGSLAWPRVLGLAFTLITVAWPLRVIPAITGDSPSEPGKDFMAMAGVLLMAGLALVAAASLRTALLVARSQTTRSSQGIRVTKPAPPSHQ